MAEIEGIPLWVYTPSSGRWRHNGAYTSSRNVHVVLGYREYFKTIKDKTPGFLTIAVKVNESPKFIKVARDEAQHLVDNPDEFLNRLLGTSDYESETYQIFKQICDRYKVYIMKRRIESCL